MNLGMQRRPLFMLEGLGQSENALSSTLMPLDHVSVSTSNIIDLNTRLITRNVKENFTNSILRHTATRRYVTKCVLLSLNDLFGLA